MKMKNFEKEYFTRDFALAVFLATVKPMEIKLRRLEQINEREVRFVFDNFVKCNELALAFFSNNGLVDAKTYANKMKDFKGLLRSVTLDNTITNNAKD